MMNIVKLLKYLGSYYLFSITALFVMLKQFIYFSVILHCACICGCKSPLDWFNEADEKAASHIKNAQNRDNLRVEKISVDNPADTLRRRLIEAQGITVADSLSATSSKEEISIDEKFREPIYITLEDALKIAAAENREFRSQKEDLYRSALALDLEAHNFRTTFAGLMSSSLSSTSQKIKIPVRAAQGANTRFCPGSTTSTKIDDSPAHILCSPRVCPAWHQANPSAESTFPLPAIARPADY
jgi:hypothetical protein